MKGERDFFQAKRKKKEEMEGQGFMHICFIKDINFLN